MRSNFFIAHVIKTTVAAKTSRSRQTSDIIRLQQITCILHTRCIIRFLLFFCSLLVNIYGSREVFVSEYRNLLADRLLQSLAYDTSREVSLHLLR